MPLRMLRYYTDIRFAGHQGPIRQFLVYIGTAPLAMADGIEESGLLGYHYGLVDMHRVNCAGLLVQDNPDALVLAVPCDFGDREPQEVINYIVRRLKELIGANEGQFREYMAMLEILSGNIHPRVPRRRCARCAGESPRDGGSLSPLPPVPSSSRAAASGSDSGSSGSMRPKMSIR